MWKPRVGLLPDPTMNTSSISRVSKLTLATTTTSTSSSVDSGISVTAATTVFNMSSLRSKTSSASLRSTRSPSSSDSSEPKESIRLLERLDETEEVPLSIHQRRNGQSGPDVDGLEHRIRDDQEADLHVLVLPTQLWDRRRHLAQDDAVAQSRSIGFIRVRVGQRLSSLRTSIELLLETERCFENNNDYTFLRRVGRHLARVKAQQEHQLIASDFLPPATSNPELLLLHNSNPKSNKQIEKDKKDINDVVWHQGLALAELYFGTPFRFEPEDRDANHIYDDLPDRPANYLTLSEEHRLLFDRQEERLMNAALRGRHEHLIAKRKFLNERLINQDNHVSEGPEKFEQMYENEKMTTNDLELRIARLRTSIDATHASRLQRLDGMGKKGGRSVADAPSKRANFKMEAARLQVTVYEASRRLRLLLLRLEQEQRRRDVSIEEVRRLRALMSEKRSAVSMLTKGIPAARIDVRSNQLRSNMHGKMEKDSNVSITDPNKTNDVNFMDHEKSRTNR